IAEISYLLLMSIPSVISFGMSEPIVNFFLLLAGVCAVKYASCRKAAFLVLAGIFTSFAIHTNPIAIPASFFIFWLVYEFILPNPLRFSRELLLFAIPFLLPFLLFFAYLLYANSLSDYWFVCISNSMPALPVPNAAAFLTIGIIGLPLLGKDRKVLACFGITLFYLLVIPGASGFTSWDFLYHRSALFLPFFCLLLSNFSEKLKTRNEHLNCAFFILFVLCYLNSFFVSEGSHAVYNYDIDAYAQGSISAHEELYSKFGKEINGKELAVFGYDVSPYIYLNAVNPTKYYYLISKFKGQAAINADIQKTYAEKQAAKPFDYLLIHEDFLNYQFVPQAINTSIQRGGYSLIYKKEFSTPSRRIDIELKSTLYLYKRT
ncbi:hypothetical protein COV61_05310, partial [Candidatus Micrarchaeota archaeon CG11_big_fil_rev_8_21_14_0_20_47_5]